MYHRSLYLYGTFLFVLVVTHGQISIVLLLASILESIEVIASQFQTFTCIVWQMKNNTEYFESRSNDHSAHRKMSLETQNICAD